MIKIKDLIINKNDFYIKETVDFDKLKAIRFHDLTKIAFDEVRKQKKISEVEFLKKVDSKNKTITKAIEAAREKLKLNYCFHQDNYIPLENLKSFYDGEKFNEEFKKENILFVLFNKHTGNSLIKLTYDEYLELDKKLFPEKKELKNSEIEILLNPLGFHLKECPHGMKYRQNSVMVGDKNCKRCGYFKGIEDKMVLCSYGEN